ncbi:hypothetical protein ACFYXM_10585 [Streptomyces sp. NPDC002476]|uniref:hypothetical protein n=1 Tax=Streptomyces sp. NPDC002476 TaxID=3364648 RepID=UPI00369382D6
MVVAPSAAGHPQLSRLQRAFEGETARRARARAVREQAELVLRQALEDEQAADARILAVQRAVEAAEQYFSRLAQPREQAPRDTADAWTSGPEGSTRARPTIDSAVLAVLAPGGPMTLADIYAGVAGVRPGTKNNNIRSSLDRLRRVRRVERAGPFRQGLYRIADPEKAGPAHN